MWLEEGETEDSMVDAMHQDFQDVAAGKGGQGTVWWTQSIGSQDGAGSRSNRRQYGGSNV